MDFKFVCYLGKCCHYCRKAYRPWPLADELYPIVHLKLVLPGVLIRVLQASLQYSIHHHKPGGNDIYVYIRNIIYIFALHILIKVAY